MVWTSSFCEGYALSALEPFSVHTERNGGTVRLKPSGELDIAAVADFDRSFDEAVEQAPDAIVVELSQVTFIAPPACVRCSCSRSATRATSA